MTRVAKDARSLTVAAPCVAAPRFAAPGIAALALIACFAIPRDSYADDAGATAISDAGVVDSGPADADLDGAKIWTSCFEHVPSEALRPKFKESFPARGMAGHALPLRILVEHGKGETVFPNGINVQSGSETARALAEAGFHVPSPDGGSGPSVSTTLQGDRAVTEVTISFVALPAKAGRQQMLLPPVPVAVARASGELVTLCTAPHSIQVEDPTASVPDAMPKPNPAPRHQRELWTLARDLSYGLIIGGAVAALLTWLILKWIRRPKPVPPPPPPRPPWEIAFEELAAVRKAGLAAKGQFSEHYDLVSDAVRRYLGLRYGFDGIESTSDEVVQCLRATSPPVSCFAAIVTMLEECDLVKFARMAPTPEDCDSVLKQAEQVVRDTMPHGPPSSTRAPHAGGAA
ncbi:MAG: hypothetical protein HY898_32430 [Deltaproteobacteria bacterium]|nr:hypothetical protein [Deltaproteobacteria bacterium]